MFCSKCGKELPQDTRICPSCGINANESPLTLPQESDNMGQPLAPRPSIYADPPTYEPEPVQKPRKKGVFFKVIAIVLLVAILISGIAVLGYYTFLPARTVLPVAQYFTQQKHNQYIESAMKRSSILDKVMNEGSIKSESELSLLLDKQLFIDFGGVDEKTADFIDQYLKNVSLRFNVGVDVPNEQLSASLGLLVLKNPAMSLNMFMDKTRLGFSLPELSPTIITGELKDITRLSTFFPDSIDEYQLEALTELDIWGSLKEAAANKLSAADLQKLASTYSDALLKGLQSGRMSIKRGRTTEFFGQEITCQEITITLDTDAQKQVIMTLLDTLMEDETTYNFVKNTFGTLYQKYAVALMPDDVISQETTPELSKGTYKSIIKLLKRNLEDLDERFLPEEITVRIYIDGLDIVKYTVGIPITLGGDEIVIAYENLLDGDDRRIRLSLTGSNHGQTLALFISMDNAYNASDDTKDIKINGGISIEQSPESSIRASLTISTAETLQSKGKVKKNILIDLSGEQREPGKETESFSVSFTVEGDETRNRDGLTTGGDYTGKFEVLAPTMPRSIALSFALKNKTTYGEKPDIPDIAKEKVLDLGTATQDDFNAYLNELEQKLSFIMLMLGSF